MMVFFFYSCLLLLLTPPAGQAQKSPAVRLKDSAASLQASMDDFPGKDHTVPSYQQISCLDSVIR